MFEAKSRFGDLRIQSCLLDGLLLAEHAYRVANDMAAMIGELERCRVHLRDVAASSGLDRAIDRLRDFCGVQRQLMQPEDGEIDLNVMLEDLARAVVRARAAGRTIELNLRLHPLRTSSDFAWRLGAIVTEIMTNALKHGFAGRDGLMSVSLEQHEGGIACTVADDGIGAGDWRPKDSGSGCRIVEALAENLGGSVERSTSTTGTTIRLVFPRFHETDVDKRDAGIASRSSDISMAIGSAVAEVDVQNGQPDRQAPTRFALASAGMARVGG